MKVLKYINTLKEAKKVTIPYIKIKEGGILPPAYYGYGYTDYTSMETYWFPIPINYAIRFHRNIKWRWDRFRILRNYKREKWEYEKTHNVHIFEVGDKAGHSGRRADAIAFNLWPSHCHADVLIKIVKEYKTGKFLKGIKW